MTHTGGQVALEALMVILLVLLACALNLELIRRSQYEALFRHACFLYVRSRALGQGVRESRHSVLLFFEGALGSKAARSVFVGLHLDDRRIAQGLEAKIHRRFPTLFRFPYRAGEKHHLELTKRCHFYF